MGSRDSETCRVCKFQRGGIDNYRCSCDIVAEQRASSGMLPVDWKAIECRVRTAETAGRLANLASCLRAAAGLQLAWKLSATMATTTCSVVLKDTPRYIKACGNLLPCKEHNTGWRPGCGRALAGWEVGT